MFVFLHLFCLLLLCLGLLLVPGLFDIPASERLGAALAHRCATGPHIFIFIKFLAAPVHDYELHRFNACRYADDDEHHQAHTDVQFRERGALVVDAVSDLWCAVSLLTAGLRAVHASLIAEFHLV